MTGTFAMTGTGALATTSILDSEEDAVLGLMSPAMYVPGEEGFRERSANLHNDSKMRELVKYKTTHQADVQAAFERDCMQSPMRRVMDKSSRAATPQLESEEIRGSLRNDGCMKVNRHMKRLAVEKAELPRMGSSGELPEAFQFFKPDEPKETEKSIEERQASLRRFERENAHMQWRECLDHGLRRLTQDLELSREDRLRKFADRMRCDHLDKVYEWYTVNSKKEPPKTKMVPPYVRFSISGPVMPGSLRVAPKTRESATSAMQALHTRGSRSEPGLGHSSSLPSLTAVGGGLEQTLLPPKVGF